jgi:hypothetical protein
LNVAPRPCAVRSLINLNDAAAAVHHGQDGFHVIALKATDGQG